MTPDHAEAVNNQVRALETMDLEGLRLEWRRRYGRPPKLRSVRILGLMLAWRIQADAFGGLDADTRRRLRSSSKTSRPPVSISAGTALTREWKGVPQTVTMTSGGYVWAMLQRLFTDLSDPIALLSRIDVGPTDIHLTFAGRAPEAIEQVSARLRPGPCDPSARRPGLHIPHRLKFRGGRTWLIGQAHVPTVSMSNTTLIEGLRRAHGYVRSEGRSTLWVDDVPETSFERKVLRLALLSPHMQREILHGRQPPMLTMEGLKSLELPLCWVDQV